jgi:predicted ribonuclease toxin of YeeF-YezG toxin-antitoxin module
MITYVHQEGVDPITVEKLTARQRVAAGAMAAAGFIPIVGWAGRIVNKIEWLSSTAYYSF